MSYQVCTNCVMDTTDPLISFDLDGVCSYCHEFKEVKSKQWFPNETGREQLQGIVDLLKAHGRGREYDAILGLSGGIDSSYLALMSKEWGLRLLVMHVDAGWNSEASVSNIEKLVNYCGYELFTYVVDWNEMRDIQLAYLKAGVSNQDVPQDHAYFAALYKFAVKHGVTTILSGGNLATEGIAPDWMFDPLDVANLQAIHRVYGSGKLKSFPRVGFLQRYFWYPLVHRLRVVRPLNYIDYRKEAALQELKRTVGWTDYGRKHGESHFTKFYQNYYLPKHGYDKRRPHLSSLIVSGQMSRDTALQKLNEDLYATDELQKDLDYVSSKLRISRSDLDRYIEQPTRDHREFANQGFMYGVMKWIQKIAQKLLGRNIKVYS